MGKWTSYKGKFEMEKEEPERLTKLREIEDKFKGESDKDVSMAYAALRQRKDVLKDDLSEVQLKIDALDRLLVARFNEKNIESLKLEKIGTFSLKPDIYASLKDTVKGFKWLRSRKLGYLIKQTVHAGALSSEVKKMIENQKKAPSEEDNGIKMTMKESIHFTKSKEQETNGKTKKTK